MSLFPLFDPVPSSRTYPRLLSEPNGDAGGGFPAASPLSLATVPSPMNIIFCSIPVSLAVDGLPTDRPNNVLFMAGLVSLVPFNVTPLVFRVSQEYQPF